MRPTLLRSNVVPSTRPTLYRMCASRQCRMVRPGSRSGAQLEVLRAWLAVTRRPGWERRRARSRRGRGLARLSSAVGPRLGRGPRLHHVSSWRGGSSGCRSGPSWHLFSVPAFVAGFAPSEHNTAVGYCTRSELRDLMRRPASAGGTRGSSAIPRLNLAPPSAINHCQDACPMAPDRSLLQLGILGSKQV